MLQKCENFHIHSVVKGLTLASLKFKSGNIVKSTKSNLKEEELKAVVRRCSSKKCSKIFRKFRRKTNTCVGVSV